MKRIRAIRPNYFKIPLQIHKRLSNESILAKGGRKITKAVPWAWHNPILSLNHSIQ